MIISDQIENRTENRSLGSSYINLATRFDKIPQSIIPAMKIVMKLYNVRKKLMIKNGTLGRHENLAKIM
jgi:hypothetical protein